MAEQKSKRGTRTRKSSDGAAADEKPTRQRSSKAETGAGTAEKEATEATGQVVEEVEEAPEAAREEGAVEDIGRREEPTVREELRSIVREAALEVLGPVTRKATTAAAKYAVTKGPQLAKDTVAPRIKDTVAPKVKDTLGPKIEEAGGAGPLAKSALSSVTGAGGGLLSKIGIGGGGADETSGTGKGRRLPVQESVDVAVPLETAYNQFTQFEDFPKFMHRVEKLEQRDETHLVWHENIWGVRREWEAEITDQRPNERIAWKSLSGTQTSGVVTFHRLSDRLTRIEVNLDFQPQGLLEKTASAFRMSRRALKSDLMRFKAFVEMREEETGSWRGRVEEGELVEGPRAEEGEEPEAEEHEEAEAEEPEAEEHEEPEAEETPVAREPVAEEPEEEELEEEEPEGEEPEAEAEEEPEEEEAEEEEPEKAPAGRRRRVRRRAPARPTRGRR
jgi:uncharacterized membrane protein